MTAWKIDFEGRVQGVGFRPFVWNLAQRHGIFGWVANTAQGVTVHAEAPASAIVAFAQAIAHEVPSPAKIHTSHQRAASPTGCEGFLIRASDPSGDQLASFLPDLGLCEDCRAELLNPLDRRYLHPFLSCTRCGPRYSITHSLPYDRPRTSMAAFPLCPACQSEYEDPRNRRYHAQPICCNQCGPQMWCESLDSQRHWQRRSDDWLDVWAQSIVDGQISLLKGLGGFHLVCDASNPDAVRRLRARKQRETKPFAVMMPHLEHVRTYCHLSVPEAGLLSGPDRPIVLLDVKTPLPAMDSIAPGLLQLGVLLPHSPVHELLFSRFSGALVVTSANRSHEPMLTSNHAARELAADWCELLVLHDRDIVNRLDDGVVAALPNNRRLSLRVGRGDSPREFGFANTKNCLALGGDLKNAVALGHHGRVSLSQHIGDMAHPDTQDVARDTAKRLCESHRTIPDVVACDAHPDYFSAALAAELATGWGVPLVQVQHHHAHLAAAWLEHQWEGEAIGLAMDGTGYGDANSIWGSEAMHYTAAGSVSLAHFEGFRLPGGDRAVREPARLLIGALHDRGPLDLLDAWMDRHPSHRQLYEQGLHSQLVANLNCPRSRGLGRLFDLVGAGLDWSDPQWDGEIGTRLENLDHHPEATAWPLEFEADHVLTGPLVASIVREALLGASPRWISSRLHATVCEMIVQLGLRAEAQLGAAPKSLPWAFAGGVFQNRKLLERLQNHPQIQSRQTYFSSFPNDNGLALGQIVAASNPHPTK